MNAEQFTSAVRKTVLSRKGFNKIFCIGYNKTGTTTLETALRLYGFNLPNQQEQESRLTRQCFSTNYFELSDFVRKFDAFQDLPFSQGLTYVVADALFPNSKFILTERDSESWFNSLISFHKKVFNLPNLDQLTERDVAEKMNYLYPGYVHENQTRILTRFSGETKIVDWENLYNKEYYIDLYERRNNEIKKYFMNSPEKLLIMDITQEKTTQKLCNFLDIPDGFVIDMPHSNKT